MKKVEKSKSSKDESKFSPNNRSGSVVISQQTEENKPNEKRKPESPQPSGAQRPALGAEANNSNNTLVQIVSNEMNTENGFHDQEIKPPTKTDEIKIEIGKQLTVETNLDHRNGNKLASIENDQQQISPYSSKSTATTINICQPQAPRLPAHSASDATSSFVRGVNMQNLF